MIEQLVSQFFSDSWDSFAMQQGNSILQENLFRARDCLAKQLWAKLSDSWFHDAYIMQFHCIDANSLIVNIRKNNETVDLCFSSVTSLECNGALIDHTASFPYTGLNRPIAQILDIWVELSENFTMIILLDNHRYLRVVCPPHQMIDCLTY